MTERTKENLLFCGIIITIGIGWMGLVGWLLQRGGGW